MRRGKKLHVEVVGGCINGSKDRFQGLHLDEIVSWSCWE